jgi:AcrR family transcriptional regulator
LATVKRRVGRPSRASERIDQILDAYTRCVALYGIEGTTLQRVADKARLARGHIRHYVGNRDELRVRFEKRMAAKYSGRATQVVDEGPAGHRAETLVRYFFRESNAPSHDYAAIDALFAAAFYDEKLRKRIRSVYVGLESLVAKALVADYPARTPAIYEHAAYQILALAYGHWTFAEIGFPSQRVKPALDLALAIVARVESAGAAPAVKPRKRRVTSGRIF